MLVLREAMNSDYKKTLRAINPVAQASLLAPLRDKQGCLPYEKL
jgi:hypothetical protein